MEHERLDGSSIMEQVCSPGKVSEGRKVYSMTFLEPHAWSPFDLAHGTQDLLVRKISDIYQGRKPVERRTGS